MAQIDIKNTFLRVCDGRRASLTPASAPGNSKLTFTDANPHRGTQWQSVDPVTVAIVVAGNNTPLSVSVSGKAITINQSTGGGGAATGTAAQIIAAYNLVAAAVALATIANFTGSTGAGITDPVAATALGNGPRALTVKIGDGNLTWDEKINRIYFKDRGILDAVRNGDEEPMALKWEFAYEFLEAVSSPQAVSESNNAAPWALSPGQTLLVQFDVGGVQTFTFTATGAVRAGGGPTLPPAAGSTLLIKVDGGAVQTVTFTGAESTPTLLAGQINHALAGAEAVVNGGNIDFHSPTQGSASSIQITGGTALVAIGHTVGTSSGSGNVPNIAAVGMADAFAVLAGLTNGTVANDGLGHLVFTSATSGVGSTAQVLPASTAVGFGFNTELNTSGIPTIEDVLEQRGNASGWVTTSTDTCEPYCIDLELEYDAPCTPPRKEFALFPMFRHESLDHDPKMSKVSVSGKCNVTQALVSEY